MIGMKTAVNYDSPSEDPPDWRPAPLISRTGACALGQQSWSILATALESHSAVLQQALSLTGPTPPEIAGTAPQDAVLMLDGEARVMWCNAAAQQLLSRGKWLTLTGPPHDNAPLRLLPPLSMALPWLRAHLKRLDQGLELAPAPPALWHSGSPNWVDCRGGTQVLLMRAQPLHWPEALTGSAPAGGATQLRLLLLMLRTPMDRRLDLPLLAELYKLTLAEQRVLERLCQGQEAAQIARAQGVQTNTIQAQIKSLLHKTSTGKQAQLVSLALRMGLGG